MKIRPLFATSPEGKWKAGKSLLRDIPLLLISQAFNSRKSWRARSPFPLAIQRRSSRRGQRTMFPKNLPKHRWRLPHPWTTQHRACAGIHIQPPGSRGVFEGFPLRIPSCSNTGVRVTKSGNFGLNSLPDWRKSQLVGWLVCWVRFGFFKRDRNKCQSARYKANLKSFVYLTAKQNNKWIRRSRKSFRLCSISAGNAEQISSPALLLSKSNGKHYRSFSIWWRDWHYLSRKICVNIPPILKRPMTTKVRAGRTSTQP